MSYASLAFWGLLGLVLLGVVALPQRLRPVWLIAVSLWFYAAPDPWRLVWLAGVAAVALAAVHLPRGKGTAWALRGPAVAILVVVLAWGKFADALGLPDPGAPPGLSFFSFTAIALIVETARRGAGWRPFDSLLHLAWFPKLLAGPIERPQTLIPQFQGLAVRPALAGLGLAFLLSGLVKKLVIADNLAPLVDATFAIPAHAAPVDLVLAVYFFAFQIYCDFSGYADIAIGLSALVGLRLTANFDRPYLSPTVAEFWASRWHITLGQWFRDFVYFPLGGSRKGRLRRGVNLLAVFLLSGLWHAGLGYGVGWGFLVWGLLNGVLVVAEGFVPTPRSPLARALRTVLTFHLILLTWVFFRAATPAEALTILARIGESLGALPGLIAGYPFGTDHKLGLVLIVLLLLAEIALGPRPLAERLAAAPGPLRWGGLYVALGALLLFGRWADTGFIYAGF